MDSEKSLVSLAILKVNWNERGADYIDNFVPFVGEVLRLAHDDVVSLSILQEGIKNEFGLYIPQGALKTILVRAERNNYVTHNNGVYIRNLQNIPNDFINEKTRALRILRTITDKFIKYCKDHHNVSLDETEAEKTLLDFIQKSNIPILQTAVRGTPLEIKTSKSHQDEFLIASFLLYLHERDQDGFEHVETIAKGQMIASLLFLPDINKANQKFNNLTVYLDTRIILRALGLEGKEFETPCSELLRLLLNMGVTLACFNQTYDELRGILDSLAFTLTNKSQVVSRSYSVMDYAISQGWRASDIELIIANLENSLTRLRVFIKQRPDYSIALGVNEEKLAEIVNKHLPSQKTEAQRHDIDCLTSIHRLRQSQPRYEIETCEYIFVTSNNELARASSEFFIEEYEKNTVPLCINDHTLATLAWVKNPQYANNLTAQMLISDSCAALRPDRELWGKYLHEIEKLRSQGKISSDDFHILRFSLTARNTLLESTLGSADAFTEGTIPMILARAQQNLTKNIQGHLDQEIASKELAISNYHSLAQSQIYRLNAISKKMGQLTRWGFLALLFAAAVLGLIMTLPTFLTGFDINALTLSDFAKLFLKSIIIIFALLTLYGLFGSGTILQLATKIENWVASRANQLLNQLFLPETHPDKKN